jgi:broad specificity phosphatase PhoE
LRLAVEGGTELQTVTLWGVQPSADALSWSRLRGRRVRLLDGAHELLAPLRHAGVDVVAVATAPAPDALAAHFVALHAERTLPGIAGEVARTLDAFHTAAAQGDEERYFAILPDDGVFLGTDASERWTGAEFRAFAMPYFERGPAWTYVPLRRSVAVADGGALAWFDEVLDNAAYGACRGSGVLERRGERWVLRQYNLTIPVPNDLARGVVERIRAFADGRAPVVTTVVVVRHAEKQGEEGDVELSATGVQRSVRLQQTLAALDVRAVYTSEYRRTAATVAPLCRAKNLEAQVVPAKDPRALVARIRRQNLGQTVVVAGHSNTVPELLRALGVPDGVQVRDDEYDRLFVVTLSVDEARLLDLRYGD